jgi:hypothetical protein
MTTTAPVPTPAKKPMDVHQFFTKPAGKSQNLQNPANPHAASPSITSPPPTNGHPSQPPQFRPQTMPQGQMRPNGAPYQPRPMPGGQGMPPYQQHQGVPYNMMGYPPQGYHVSRKLHARLTNSTKVLMTRSHSSPIGSSSSTISSSSSSSSADPTPCRPEAALLAFSPRRPRLHTPLSFRPMAQSRPHPMGVHPASWYLLLPHRPFPVRLVVPRGIRLQRLSFPSLQHNPLPRPDQQHPSRRERRTQSRSSDPTVPISTCPHPRLPSPLNLPSPPRLRSKPSQRSPSLSRWSLRKQGTLG